MEIEKERIRILQSGYALKHERIKVLNELAEMLLGEIKEVDKRWCPDVKSIGQGENAERVDIVRFNGSLIEQARKSLEDIAAELGERINRQELTLPGAKVKGYTVLAHPDLWDEDENAKPD